MHLAWQFQKFARIGRVDVLTEGSAADLADALRLLPSPEHGIARRRLEFWRPRGPARGAAAVGGSFELLRGQRPFRRAMPLHQSLGQHPRTAPLPGMNAERVTVLAEAR